MAGNKVKIESLSINLDTWPTTKVGFDKKAKKRFRKPDEAWDKVCELRKEISSRKNTKEEPKDKVED